MAVLVAHNMMTVVVVLVAAVIVAVGDHLVAIDSSRLSYLYTNEEARKIYSQQRHATTCSLE